MPSVYSYVFIFYHLLTMAIIKSFSSRNEEIHQSTKENITHNHKLVTAEQKTVVLKVVQRIFTKTIYNLTHTHATLTFQKIHKLSYSLYENHTS